MSTLAIRFKAEPVRTIGFAAIGVGYMGVGTALDQPMRQFFIQNLTNAVLMFSFDGIDDHFPLPGNGFFLDDITSNKSVGQGWFLAEGTRLYVRHLGVAPTQGDVYFSTFFADQ